ncbi:aldo/keto reductase [Microvirga sp. W0021]|uniref:Aldo/keto reductase n=1 Tax=Hohaiivirga grylli TaxID=3133970 RepID=A0ABV0BK38_9HYPH
MQKRKIEALEQDVSAIGLGCMGMSEFYGTSDDAQSLDTLEFAFENGINFFDTADMYGTGHNEELLAKFIKGKREQLVMGTKFGIVRKPDAYERTVDNSPAYIKQACEASLKRLGTDYIDLYYCHRRNQDTPIEEMMEALAGLVKAGKIKGIGLSEVTAETLRRAHAVHPVSVIQSEYSLWSRVAEDDVLPTCRELGVTFVAYSPLGRGFLSGKIPNINALEAGDFRRFNPRFSEEALKQNFALAEQLKEVAEQKKATEAQLALAWLLAKHDNVVPIPGTRNKDRLLENIGAADVMLTAEDIAALDQIFTPDKVIGARYPDNGVVGIETPV